MNSKNCVSITIFGIFAITAFLFTQTLADFQTSFGAKGGEPGCGDNQKAIDASGGNCVKSGDCDGGVTSGGCSIMKVTMIIIKVANNVRILDN